MKYLLIILITILTQNIGYNQSIEMQVLSSTGNPSSSSQLQYTMGEVAIAGNDNLTQGFHQGNLIITAIEDIVQDIEVIAYPNPTMNGINITSDDISSVQMRFFDMQGRQLASKLIDNFPYYIDLTKFDSGIYFIQLYDKKQILKTFKIEKIK